MSRSALATSPARRAAAATALTVAVATAGALALGRGGASDGGPLAVAAAPVTSLGLGPSCPPRSSAETVLDIAGFAYCPGTVTVGLGSEVVWTNTDFAPHTVTYDGPEGPVDSGSMAQGQAWSTRFSQPGAYRYYCRFHPGMTGTIVVAPN